MFYIMEERLSLSRIATVKVLAKLFQNMFMTLRCIRASEMALFSFHARGW